MMRATAGVPKRRYAPSCAPHPSLCHGGIPILLDLVYAGAAAVASPYVSFKMATSRRWRSGFWQRLGHVPPRVSESPCLWVHAASVGEVNASRTLVEAFAERCPGWQIVMSTVTNTGQALAHDRLDGRQTFYYPLDFSWTVRRTLSRIRPDALALIELEVWPGFFREARRRGLPIVVVNGRIREQSVPRYRWLTRLCPGLFSDRAPNRYCVQNEVYAERFRRVGVPPDQVAVTGTMKYDTVPDAVDAEARDRLRRELGIAPDEQVIVAGSTWPGEEEILLDVYAGLRENHPHLRLVLAPRHVERAGDVAECVRAKGFHCLRRSQPDASADSRNAVVLIDTIGELLLAYALADCAFVGRSLVPGGGQNLLEPAGLGVPTLFGPHTENFADEALELTRSSAARCVADSHELAAALRQLLAEPARREEMGKRARAVIEGGRGATRRNVDELIAHLERVGKAAAHTPERTENR